MDTPKISVVIVAWNRRDDVLQTIESVYEQDDSSFEVIVVDNASTDGTREAVKASFPEARLICLNENRGPTGGRNAGVKVARGEIVLCLDSDVSLEQGTLNVIVKKFENDPTIGVVNSRILNAYTHDFDPAAGWAYSEKQKAKSDQEFFSHNFSEGGCAIRKATLRMSGLFWEKLFFGREGEDLALRILDEGYKILYCPSAVVLHRSLPQMHPTSAERKFYDFRNSLYIYLVRYPWWMLVWFMPMKILAESVKGLRQGTMDWIVRALSDVIRGLPSLWRERKPIRNETARIYLKFQKIQGSLSWDLISWLKKRT